MSLFRRSLLLATLLAAPATLASSTSPTSSTSAVSPCDPATARRAIVAIRDAQPELLAQLRTRAEDDLVAAGDDARAAACAAAVVAEGAVVGGDLARAHDALAVVVRGLPGLADEIRPHQVLILAELGRVAEARAALKGVSKKSAWHDRLVAMIGPVAAQRGDERAQSGAFVGPSAERRAALRRRASRDAEALATLCSGYDDVDGGPRVSGDATSCQQLALRFPGHHGARVLEDAGTLPRFRGPALAQRLRGLLEAARPGRVVVEGAAAATDAAAFGLDADALADVVDVVASALWRLERTEEALPLTAAAVDIIDGGVVVRDAKQAKTRAKTLSRLGRGADAAAVWAAIRDVSADDAAQVGVGPAERAEAAFFAGFSFVEENAVDAALAAFARAAPHVSETPWREQTDWYVALLQLSEKQNPAAAIEPLRVLAQVGEESRKYRYFLAKALASTPKGKNEARPLYQALVQSDATDWYGLLAARALGDDDAARKKVIVPAARGALAAHAPGATDDAVMLFALGFDDEAKARCREKAKGSRRVPPISQLARCAAVDDVNFGWKHNGLLGHLRDDGDTPFAKAAWDASFPWPYGDVPVAAAARFDVPVSFVLAIMRTESGFDPRAASKAGAKGLMQLLPSSARATAAAQKLDVELTTRLFEPSANITLGAALLGLLKREHGSLLMAAAAYTGGPDNAARWAKRFGALPVDVLVERISFKETRNYVKRVLATEATYRALDGGSLALAWPERVRAPASFTPLPYDE